MADLTQTQINDKLARQLAIQWLQSRKLSDQHGKAANKDQLARGIRVLQEEHRVGAVVQGELYYYLRTEFQACCAQALPQLVKRARKHEGKPLTLADAMALSRKYEDEIQALWKQPGTRPHAFPVLLPLVREGVPFSVVELPGPEQVCGLVKQVKAVEQEPSAPVQARYALTRENGWNEPLQATA